MKKRLPMLLLLPALLLTSCAGGELSEEKSNELKAGIAEKAKDLKNYELLITSDGQVYDEDEGKNVASTARYEYRVNEDGDRYVRSFATQGVQKSDSTVYLVNNAEYQQVLYTNTYDAEEKKNVQACYGYEGNELTFAFASLYFIVPEGYLEMFVDASGFEALEEGMKEDGEEYKVSTKYYSSGEGNLTVKISASLKGEVKKDEEEKTVSANYTVEYQDYLFKSAKMSGKSSKGNNSTTEIYLTPKSSKIAIELPAGWQDIINAESDSGFDDGGLLDL